MYSRYTPTQVPRYNFTPPMFFFFFTKSNVIIFHKKKILSDVRFPQRRRSEFGVLRGERSRAKCRKRAVARFRSPFIREFARIGDRKRGRGRKGSAPVIQRVNCNGPREWRRRRDHRGDDGFEGAKRRAGVFGRRVAHSSRDVRLGRVSTTVVSEQCTSVEVVGPLRHV